MSSLWRKLQIPSKLDVFLFEKLYRKGPAASGSAAPKTSVKECVAAAFQPVEFLELDLLKGSPVDTTITSKTPDPYLERYISTPK
ncbi:hypothetical protein BgAZ_100200 [Babesia gibsoni]|uniref:Uncharacterized protein n=1 Tax=Babesia gibsoni TaxID=33632 RepID=A0AAD8PF25_BABGI|nr:hypothetical protein BgAZ_100200 [Babesia gibsoni]